MQLTLVCFLWKTTQTSLTDAWFVDNHTRHASRSVAVNVLCKEMILADQARKSKQMKSGSRVLSEFIRTRIHRQVQRECRSACLRTLKSDRSAVGFRTTADEREPQAPADLFSRLSPLRSREWIKEAGLIFGGDYRSIIVDGQFNAGRLMFCRDGDWLVRGAVFHGVRCEVPHGASQLFGIPYSSDVVGDVHDESLAMNCGKLFGETADKISQITFVEAQRKPLISSNAVRIEEILNHSLSPIDVRINLGGQVPAFIKRFRMSCEDY